MKVVQFKCPKRIYPFAGTRNIRLCWLITCLLLLSVYSDAQDTGNATLHDTIPSLTLKQCINQALVLQPALQQSLIRESIARTTNAINLSGWWPQVNGTTTFTHYLQLPTSFVSSAGGGGTNPTQTGVANTAIPGVGVTQAVFSPSLLYASKTAPLYVKQAEQVTDSTKIELAAAVSKTFYALLLTLQQVEVLKEDTIRLTRSMSDAYHQYVGGIVDETDYQQAAITLNNSMAQLKQAVENIVPQYAALKQLIGYLPEKHFNISYDTTEMLKEVQIDTTQQLQYEKRIEYKQLITAKELQHQQTNYYRRAALPTIAALYNYNLAFGNKDYPKLFSAAYPNSYIGLSLNVPIFTGFARVHNIHRSQLQEKLLDWNQVNLRMTIYSQYTSALANYKSNLYNLALLQHNVTMAKRVYFVVDLQYKQGIVPYLNVITGESNLITSQINYLNALFQLLSSKIDLEKAMGDISY